MTRFNLAIIFAMIALVAVAGCGPKTVGVSGKVVVDGRPAENVRVVFQSASKDLNVSPTAVGLTDREGAYSLSLADKKKRGAIPGSYAVYLVWQDPEADPNPVEGATEVKEAPFKLPPRANSGELRYEIPKEGATNADFIFDVSSEPKNVAPRI